MTDKNYTRESCNNKTKTKKTPKTPKQFTIETDKATTVK